MIVRPHLARRELDDGYRAMADDEMREAQAPRGSRRWLRMSRTSRI